MDTVDEGRIVKVDGESFQKLSPNDRQKLLSPVKTERRANLRENLKDGGITGKEFVNEMDAFDGMIFGDLDFFDYMRSIQGRAEIIGLACRKANPDGPAMLAILDDLTIDVEESFTLAALLGGVKMKAAAATDATDDEDDKAGEPRPSGAGV